MQTLLISFGVWINDISDTNIHGEYPHGPLFNKWLPDGENDAITLPTDDAETTLSVYFKRFGHHEEDTYLKFDLSKQESDPNIIARQGRLDAGPLYGKLTIQNIDDDVITVLQHQTTPDDRYGKLGKRITKAIHQPVENLVTILKVCYGQYWLNTPAAWDSRQMSLGVYCKRWNMKWSLDGNKWAAFKPDNSNEVRIVGKCSIPNFSDFLTQSDWKALSDMAGTGYAPSIPLYLLRRCHRLLVEGETRYALIEGVSSLELAIEDFVRRKSGSLVQKVFNTKFEDMMKIGKMALVTYLTPGIAHTDIELAANAIDARNKVIHEGAEPPHDVENLLQGVIRVVSKLVEAPVLKFPRSNSGNELAKSDDL